MRMQATTHLQRWPHSNGTVNETTIKAAESHFKRIYFSRKAPRPVAAFSYIWNQELHTAYIVIDIHLNDANFVWCHSHSSKFCRNTKDTLLRNNQQISIRILKAPEQMQISTLIRMRMGCNGERNCHYDMAKQNAKSPLFSSPLISLWIDDNIHVNGKMRWCVSMASFHRIAMYYHATCT